MKNILSHIESSDSTGWCFGSIGSPTGKTKCCMVTDSKDLYTVLLELPKMLESTDKYVAIDTSIFADSFEETEKFAKLFHKIAVENGVAIVSFTEKIEDIFEHNERRRIPESIGANIEYPNSFTIMLSKATRHVGGNFWRMGR